MLMDGRTGIEVIDRDECLALLAAESVGRIAVIAGAEPVIFPVNYAMDGETIVFRTAVGSKFAAAVRGTRVSFEIDRFDPRPAPVGASSPSAPPRRSRAPGSSLGWRRRSTSGPGRTGSGTTGWSSPPAD